MGKKFGRDDGDQNGKPKKQGFKQTSKRLRRSKEEASLKNRASLDWHLDLSRVCAVGGHDADIVSIEELKSTIMKSRTGESLLTGAGTDKLEVVYDTQTPASQYYPRADRRVIALNPYRPKGDLINLLVRELRRAWQHENGALVNPLTFDPDEAILVNRAQQADALMMSIKVSWELKLIGLTEAWDHLAGSPMVDVTRTFEIKAQTDFRTLNNGHAARAAYDKFFEDSRTKLHDKKIIHQMLLDESGYIRSQEKRKRVSMDLFKRMGEVPNGRNYLAMKSSRTPMDACYATVEDRSNANFLWFIKFERSFHEKERQMIEESVKLSAEIVDFAKWAMKSGRNISVDRVN